jgi:transcriptional regulator with XRE-family HTH domain
MKQGVFIMIFGEKLQLLRKQKGLSQEKLSEQLKASRQA